MSSFTDQYIDDTFKGILHVGGVPLPASGLINVFDGNGNQSSLNLGRDGSGLSVSGTLSASGILTSGNVTYPTSSTGVNLLDLIYPVGSVYFSTVFYQDFNIFGGTWVQTAQGRFIAGVGEGTDKNSVKKTYVPGNDTSGEYAHSLTSGEGPTHDHSGVGAVYGAGEEGIPRSFLNKLSGKQILVHENAGHTSSILPANRGLNLDSELLIDSSGSGTAHNNTPPAFGLYVYTRTA